VTIVHKDGVIEGQKLCPRCERRFPMAHFYRCNSKKEWISSVCIACTRRYNREWNVANRERLAELQKTWTAENPEAVKRHVFTQQLKKYGMTIEDYEVMLKKQGGRCALCRRKAGKRRLAVDHCHRTNRVRGLLCAPCNMGIGCFGDDPDLLGRVIAYLTYDLEHAEWEPLKLSPRRPTKQSSG
jgi:Autographiviridae endonuclease VII